jgi:hypothetical protein
VSVMQTLLFYTRLIGLSLVLVFISCTLVISSAVRAQSTDIERRLERIDQLNLEHRLSVLETKAETVAYQSWAMLTGMGALMTEALQRVIKGRKPKAAPEE